MAGADEIPPLAGLFTYEEAARSGYSVDEAAERLWRLAYVYRRLHGIAVDVLPRTPEWEVKCALGLHLWLDAEHANALEGRLNELRHPSVDAGMPPDARLGLALDELAHVGDTAELLGGVYLVVRAALVEALTTYLATTNPLADHPSVRLVEAVLRDEERAVAWGRSAAGAPQPGGWSGRIAQLVAAAGGVLGDGPSAPAPPVDELRSSGGPPTPDRGVRRDARFRDLFNESALIDAYWEDPARPADERVYALAYKRLREMDVPEWMAPIIADSEDQPWDRRAELSRQLWDEMRHAMMGEVALERQGVRFHAFPIPAVASIALNTRFTPYEAHLMLWKIEQDLMAADTGKRRELEVARAHGDPLLATFQDFDWADEILHARTGRRWLLADFPTREAAEQAADEILARYEAVAEQLRAGSEQGEWWPQLVAAMRRGALR
jgi:hypothetical protein